MQSIQPGNELTPAHRSLPQRWAGLPMTLRLVALPFFGLIAAVAVFSLGHLYNSFHPDKGGDWHGLQDLWPVEAGLLAGFLVTVFGFFATLLQWWSRRPSSRP